jgi:ribonuclease P protein component
VPGNVQRLQTRTQFQAVLAGGTVAKTAHFALHRTPLQAPPRARTTAIMPPEAGEPALFDVSTVWMGAMVPKRWARRAVTRNAVKRQIYAVSALFESRLPLAAHVVRLRASFDRSQFKSASSVALKQAVRAELMQLLGQAVGPAGA